MTMAKLFKNGRSQAVRLPKEFRFEGEAVNIRREGNAVILEPVATVEKDPWAWLDTMPGELDEDFVKAALDRPGWSDDDIDPEVLKFFK
ncbi:antitoxin [uncultured Devosia sp.]|uniref:antitoxin n=1 Tax=uncultured Devosia sp. TaxID=211434 RepID=UPI0035CC85BE